MKPLVVALFFTSLLITLFSNCNESSDSIINTVNNSKDSSAKVKSDFDSLKIKFQELGFTINSKISDGEVDSAWKAMLQYNSNQSESFYITLGNTKDYNAELYYCKKCSLFDIKSIEGKGSYKTILETLSRISDGDLNFQNIQDYCDDNEDNKAWVSFKLNGDEYKWNLKVDDTYIDENLFYNIQHLCKKYNKKGRLTYFSDGEQFVISYLTDDEFAKFNIAAGLTIEWLNENSDLK
jgi:hypothetical protein